MLVKSKLLSSAIFQTVGTADFSNTLKGYICLNQTVRLPRCPPLLLTCCFSQHATTRFSVGSPI